VVAMMMVVAWAVLVLGGTRESLSSRRTRWTRGSILRWIHLRNERSDAVFEEVEVVKMMRVVTDNPFLQRRPYHTTPTLNRGYLDGNHFSRGENATTVNRTMK